MNVIILYYKYQVNIRDKKFSEEEKVVLMERWLNSQSNFTMKKLKNRFDDQTSWHLFGDWPKQCIWFCFIFKE